MPQPLTEDASSLPPLSSSLEASSSFSASSGSFSASPSTSEFPQATVTLPYPSLEPSEDMAPRYPVTLIMGTDLRIGRASVGQSVIG